MIALQATALRRQYGGLRALDDLHLDVLRHEIHAIVGLNGAGKTTFMRAATGMTRLDAGELRVLGDAVSNATPSVWAQVGHMIEYPFAYPELTVCENIVASGRLHWLDTVNARARADLWIDRLALGQWAHRPARALSLGNRQRLGIACALVHAPRLVILDEPTSALDPSGVLLLRDAVVESAASGAGVLVSSHHLDEVSRIAHRISVVHGGRVIGTLKPGTPDIERAFFAMLHAWDASNGNTSHERVS